MYGSSSSFFLWLLPQPAAQPDGTHSAVHHLHRRCWQVWSLLSFMPSLPACPFHLPSLWRTGKECLNHPSSSLPPPPGNSIAYSPSSAFKRNKVSPWLSLLSTDSSCLILPGLLLELWVLLCLSSSPQPPISGSSRHQLAG